ARFFVDRGLDDYTAWVAERLGTTSDRVERGPILSLLGKTFDPLHFLILERNERRGSVFYWVESRPVLIPGDGFAQPETGPVLLTHADVRSITLSRFRDASGGPIWDIGAGLGGVAVDLARAFPGSEVVAFERSEAQRAYLRENRLRFAAYNLRV